MRPSVMSTAASTIDSAMQAHAQEVINAALDTEAPAYKATQDPDLIEVFAPRPEWDAPLWLVTHVDLHRTRKVQAFLSVLKDAAKTWTL